MNEQVLPVLKYWDYVPADVFFKYSNQIDMSMENKIKLYDMLTNKYEMSAETIDADFGITVGKQFNIGMSGGSVAGGEDGNDDHHIMSDEEYYRRYGHRRGEKVNAKVNFLDEVR
jgi:hypothetical protein